ncbi:hypothetical protein DFH07DRAFT_256083 [Mycena maculata]|uniref:ATP-dependent DNA helicase n=1 Tax=Mycena maculata TaxID=230809 RepID=A0AAD7JS82_9AGAR|nr:hypothetical protein DFH07DRAFT_256083 [Mycena maculata]
MHKSWNAGRGSRHLLSMKFPWSMVHCLTRGDSTYPPAKQRSLWWHSVLSGDFFQLPPVPNRDGDKTIPPTFAFDSKTWESCMGHPVTLTRVFRQKDQAFVDILNAMRFGKIDNLDAFKALEREVKYTDGIDPTELLSTRAEVDRVNNSRLDKLPGECQTYLAMEYRGINSKGERVSQEQMGKLLDRLVVPKLIRLKVCLLPRFTTLTNFN